MTNSLFRALACPAIFLLGSMFVLAGCERTLVFGESTGLNIGINVDATKKTLEVNTGFKRQVVGIIPASEESVDGFTNGEAVSMISRFQLRQEKTEDNDPFNNKIIISSAFASGKAAVAIVTLNSDAIAVVNAIVMPKTLTASTNPLDISTANKLGTYVGQSSNNVTTYLNLAKIHKLNVPPDGLPRIRATKAIFDGRNASGNREILKALKL